MKEFDRIYIAKYCEKIEISEIAKSFFKPKQEIYKEIKIMIKNGTFAIYKNLSDEEWEKLENKTNQYIKDKYYKVAENRKREVLLAAFRVDIHEIISEFPKYNYSKREFNRDYMQEADYENEEWKQIGKLNYLISNYGRIKNKTTKKLKQLKFQNYGMQVILWQNSKSYTITISRIVAEMFIRHLEKNERVFHKNNNIRDNYYKNLYIDKIGGRNEKDKIL